MKAATKKNHEKNVFRKSVPLYLVLIAAVLSVFLVYSFFPHPESRFIRVPEVEYSSEMNLVQNKHFKYTHPVILADLKTENPKLNGIKEKLTALIEANKSNHRLSDLSVYYRNLNDGSWFEINGADKYIPASLMKVSYMIAILKQAEKNPELPDKRLYFEKHFEQGYNQNIKTFSLKEKKNYSVRDLLEYMITYSDNDATSLLASQLDPVIYSNLFTDLNIAPPPVNPPKGSEYYMTVVDYCKLFRVLYNSSYLNEKNSDLALDLLTKSTFKDGFLKNTSFNFPVAHKFGERIVSNVQELHEVGIFFDGAEPYLLGVMSSGRDLGQLSDILGVVSKTVYEDSYKVK